MIPEHYWKIARRWYWLIGGIAAFAILSAIVVGPKVLEGGSPGYSSAVTLGVTRVVTLNGTVIGAGGQQDLLASYTENLANRGNTPQFRRELSTRLKDIGVTVDDTTLARKLTFTPNPGLFRVDITVQAATADDAELIASTAATLMAEDITAEERRIRDTLNTATAEQQTALLAKLTQVYTDRTARLAALGEPVLREGLDELLRSGISSNVTTDFTQLVQTYARITSDSELTVLNSSATSLEQQLAQLSDTQRSFSDDILLGNPISVVDPVDTVALQPKASLRTRDLALMGLVVGLVLGWMAATFAEGNAIGEHLKRAKRDEWDAEPASPVAAMERFFSHD